MPIVKNYLELVVEKIAFQKGTLIFAPEPLKPKDKITVQCEHGHIWTPMVRQIINGHWCYQCYINHQRGSIKPGHETILSVVCGNEHTWTPTLKEILQDAPCPFCKPKKAMRLSILSCLGRTRFSRK